jgi:hypothetical protein
VPYSPSPNGNTTEDAKRSYEWWRNVLAALALLISALALTVSIISWRTAEKTFYATRRAAINLGTPDGRVGQWVTEGGEPQLALYFRNYGPTAGQKFMVEKWLIVTVAQQGFETTTSIPPPEELLIGPSIPPGFTYVIRITDPGVTQEELTSGRKDLLVVGRVRYADSFDRYCEDFSIGYNRPLSQFVLTTPISEDLCDSREDTVQTRTVIAGDGRVETHFSPYRAR